MDDFPINLNSRVPFFVNNQILTSNNYSSIFQNEKKNETEEESTMRSNLLFQKSESSIYMINNVMDYESPLKCFRGYRFSFCDFDRRR